MKKIYVCNDTITGIFSAIYDAWKEGREEKDTGGARVAVNWNIRTGAFL